jgi:NAD(P)H-nitrite reductase large subunit
MLVISAGIRPNVEVAKSAGLTVERGIVVGDDLACVNDTSIYAIGECAQHRGQTYGLVGPCWKQGQILADRLSRVSTDATYKGSTISTKLKIMGVDLVVLGEKEAADDKDEVEASREGPAQPQGHRQRTRDRESRIRAGRQRIAHQAPVADVFSCSPLLVSCGSNRPMCALKNISRSTKTAVA